MAGRAWSPEVRAKISQNKNVLRVSETQITYSPDFKVEAVRANLIEGKTPQVIFVDAGFDLDLIGRQTPKRCLDRWRAVFQELGEHGLRNDQRGKGAMGRPLERELTVDEKLRRAEARVKYLERENEVLKKFRALERTWSTDHRRSTH
jgi:hypothetical protein